MFDDFCCFSTIVNDFGGSLTDSSRFRTNIDGVLSMLDEYLWIFVDVGWMLIDV